MTQDGNRATAGRILVFTAFLMLVGALLIWTRVIPVHDPIRTTVSVALGAAGVADLIMAVFFLKGSNGSGRI